MGHLVLHQITMRTLILIVVFFKVQISLALEEGNPTQSCLKGKACLFDSQCGENGQCQFPDMTTSGKATVGSCLCKEIDVTEDYDYYEQLLEDVENLDNSDSDEEYYEKPKNDLLNLDLNMKLPNLPSLLSLFQGQRHHKCKNMERCNGHFPCGEGGKCIDIQWDEAGYYGKCRCKCKFKSHCNDHKDCGIGGKCYLKKKFCVCANMCRRGRTCNKHSMCGFKGRCTENKCECCVPDSRCCQNGVKGLRCGKGKCMTRRGFENKCPNRGPAVLWMDDTGIFDSSGSLCVKGKCCCI